jgi:hypothetical protein
MWKGLDLALSFRASPYPKSASTFRGHALWFRASPYPKSTSTFRGHAVRQDKG